jgi:hypothetical protein
MAYPSVTLIRRGLAFNPNDDALLRRVRDQLASQVGRASYVAAVLYGLRLAAAHLGIDAQEPVALPPVEPTPGLVVARLSGAEAMTPERQLAEPRVGGLSMVVESAK